YAVPKNKQVETWSQLGSTSSLIRKVAEEKGMKAYDLSGELIFEWAEKGDETCIHAIEEFYFILAVGIHNLQHVYDPELILLGGGISEREDFVTSLMEKVEEVQALMDLHSIVPTIRTCKFKNQANVLGAVYHFLLSLNNSELCSIVDYSLPKGLWFGSVVSFLIPEGAAIDYGQGT